MSDRLGSLRHLSVRIVLAETLVPVGVAAAAGIAVSMIVPPHWRAVGLPYLLGYGKNVESDAVAAALAAGASTQLFVGSRRGLRACALLAAFGFALVAARCAVVPLLSGWPQFVVIAAIAAAIGTAGSGGAAVAGTVGAALTAAPGAARGAPRLVAAALVAILAGLVFALSVGPLPALIDVFHHGEVLSTAVDLLQGGRPFETLLWPHGLHDTGLAALWIGATGKVGTSPVALAWVSCCALGIVSAYVLARRLLGSRFAALSACLAFAMAPLLFGEPQAAAAARTLFQLGVLVFVALVLAAVTSPRCRPFAAGLCCALAYLFRIETGVYASLAALAVISYRELAAAGGAAGGAVKALARSVFRFAAGGALVLAGARLILGWPGAAWYAYTLADLPRYHRDAVGIPLPWPVRGRVFSPAEAASLPTFLARLLLTLLLLVQALRALLAARGRRPCAAPPRATQLLFVALFAALAVKSALDRSDVGHLLQWTALPLLVASCLAVAARSDAGSWGTRRAGAAVLALLLVLLAVDMGSLGFRVPALRGPAALAGAASAHWQAFVEHLSPNPPVGACADRMFTPGETRLGVNRRFITDECAVEGLLRSHGVGRMVIADSAPWYDVRFHLAPASRYFALARAYTPARQFELIAALRARPAQALLRPRGYNALGDFDLSDALRVPVADAYLRGRAEGVAVTPTPLGDLFLWNEPSPPAAWPAGGSAAHASPGLSAARRFGKLSGAEWAGVAAAIDRAAALGRADRAAALARR
jgi:hypothetical protein